MSNGPKNRLQAMDATTLTPLVRQALDSATAQVADWRWEELHGGAGAVSGRRWLYRLAGTARDQGETREWSLVLKILHSLGDRADPLSSKYWKREVLAYQSGLLDSLPGGLVAPCCFGVDEQPNGELWLWLEDIADHFGSVDEIGPQWPLAHYGVVARHLGQFNGAYLAGRSMPTWPWLGRGWMRENVGLSVSTVERRHSALDHPLVRRAYPPDVNEGLDRLWAERERFLSALERLPQTLAHLDASSRNLFARRGADGEYQTVAIDWAYVGRAAVGEEVTPLVAVALWFLHVDGGQIEELDRLVFGGYVDGLRDAGWPGDQRAARRGYAAAFALRFGLVQTGLSGLLDESTHGLYERIIGRSMEEIADAKAEQSRFLLGLADEARGLMEDPGRDGSR